MTVDNNDDDDDDDDLDERMLSVFFINQMTN